MSKILKFRAYDTRTKKWIVDEFHILGEFVLFGGFDDWISNNEFKELGLLERYNDIIIQQFTGLQDKNNVNVFEGDIIKYILSTKPLIEGTAKITWYNFGWEMTELDDTGSSPLIKLENMEIIGNIFDNSELLK